MDKKEKLKYLSQWSGLQKNILDNLDYGYSKELVKIAKETAEQYNRTYNQLFSSEMLAQVKQMQNEVAKLKTQRLFGGIDLDEIKKLQEALSPSLNDTIKNLTASYGDKTAIQKAIEDMNKVNLTRFDVAAKEKYDGRKFSNISIFKEVSIDEKCIPVKITQIKLHNFRFFCGENDKFVLENGESMLLYGENGSGKSSLYKAFELFIKGDIGKDEFKSNTNIHKQDNPYIEFEFDNDEVSIRIDDGHLQLDNSYLFVKNLSTIKPMLDYKDLLRIYFTTSENNDSHNLFPLFKELFNEYPLEGVKILKDLGDTDAYFNKLKEIVLELEPSINAILERFGFDIVVDKIVCDAHSSRISINISSSHGEIANHAEFLNEAKLSALALSIFFSVILKLYEFMPEKSLKILVLDDLLLSLNMSNRHRVLDLLLDKELFDDFQFFIFTHDRAFFEVAKHKFDHNQKNKWKYFELYIDDSEEFEKPFIKESNQYFEKSKELFKNKEYSECANNLRKEAEKLLIQFLPESERKKKGGGKLLLQGLIGKAWSYANNEKNYQKLDTVLKKIDSITDYEKFHRDISNIIKETDDKKRSKERLLDILHDLEEFKNTILNPQSHHDIQSVLYKKELEDAMELIRKFKEILELNDGKA